MTYKLTREGYVLRSDGARISTFDSPEQPNLNPDYLDYKAWLAAGGVPEPAEPLPVVVPPAVTMRQARLALLSAALLDDVDPAIAAIPDAAMRREAEIEWEFSNELQRANPFVALLGGGLGLSSAQVDALFVQAAGL
ncbi:MULTISPECIES: hypothetical protein [unclassified Acidovorax]|uniref:hypothetical protein n=1 Tax=unclassified Acidovorax TaxID=2684926 RepID=UPI001C478CD4|nr:MULTISPECIES: hypothetical protein [unclassified Acidovorax]MBV7427271.1 hypothetical protein [Acidovorax sp. sif0732]MBV7448395.1 hypothetical protein [Acidovorax sp. sif0715]